MTCVCFHYFADYSENSEPGSEQDQQEIGRDSNLDFRSKKPCYSQLNISPISSPDNCCVSQDVKSNRTTPGIPGQNVDIWSNDVIKRPESKMVKQFSRKDLKSTGSPFTSTADGLRELSNSLNVASSQKAGKVNRAASECDKVLSDDDSATELFHRTSVLSLQEPDDKQELSSAYVSHMGLPTVDMQNILPVFMFETVAGSVTSVKVSFCGNRFTEARLNVTHTDRLMNEDELNRDKIELSNDHSESELMKATEVEGNLSFHSSKAKNVELVAAKLSQK